MNRATLMFRVWQDDETEECALEVMEADAEDAATRWAQEYDADGDYTIVQGANKTVHVRNVHGGQLYTYRVFGEAEPRYYAKFVNAENLA